MRLIAQGVLILLLLFFAVAAIFWNLQPPGTKLANFFLESGLPILFFLIPMVAALIYGAHYIHSETECRFDREEGLTG